MQEADLLVSGRYLVTMDDRRRVLENGAVAIAGTTILEIGDRAALERRHPGAERLHEEHGVVMPGLINVHTHAAMTCFRGLADDLRLMTWLQEHIFPREARLTGDMVYRATRLALCEMIRSGTTSFCDMYLFAADVARAAEEAGIRAWVGEVLYDFPSPNYGELKNGLRHTEELLASYTDHPLINVTVDPHAVYTCSPELLRRLGDLAAAHGALCHTHLAETQEEVRVCLERYGVTPARHLDSLGLLGERLLAAHCVVLDKDEIRLLADRGVKVLHCAESNMKLASGCAPVVSLLEAGVIVGLGTDGAASNNDLDMFGEMNSVAKLQKVVNLDPTVMDAATTLWAATRGGAAVLGAEARLGALETGKQADLIVLDFDQAHLTPVYNPVSHLVYAARGGDVLHSIINGRVVMRNRLLTTLDEPAILLDSVRLGEELRALHG